MEEKMGETFEKGDMFLREVIVNMAAGLWNPGGTGIVNAASIEPNHADSILRYLRMNAMQFYHQALVMSSEFLETLSSHLESDEWSIIESSIFQSQKHPSTLDAIEWLKTMPSVKALISTIIGNGGVPSSPEWV
jgi:hypothetical protein